MLPKSSREVDDWFAFFPGQRQAHPEQDREQQDLEQVPLGKGVHRAGGDDVHQEIDGSLRFGGRGQAGQGFRVDGGRVGVDSGPGLDDVDHDKPDDQGQCGDDLEIEDGLAAHAAYRLDVFHLGDAHGHGAEDDGSDDHLDEVDERVSQRLEINAQRGIEVPDQDTENQGDNNLEIQTFTQTPGHYLLSCSPSRLSRQEGRFVKYPSKPCCMRCARHCSWNTG